MKPFDYTVPTSVDDAIRSGVRPATRYIVGGTNLVDLMKLEVETPEHLVDLNPLAESDRAMGSITELPGGGLRIGALARMSDVAWDPRVKDAYPVLSQSLLLAASGLVASAARIPRMASSAAARFAPLESFVSARLDRKA